MKKLIWLTLTTLALGSSLAFAEPEEQKQDEVWLKTSSRWTRLDYYGNDLNRNGRIDDNEWTKRRTTGSGKQPSAWSRVPVREGESHRWSVSSEEVWVEEPAKASLTH